jgi:SpoVK/Ycf46/Vps4 family AAA+-type ATPase
MGQVQDLMLLIRSGTPLILIETEEELRAIELFEHLLQEMLASEFDSLRPLFRWSITSGLKRLDLEESEFGARASEPEDVLNHIRGNHQKSIYLLLDFHPYLEDPINTRRLREVVLGQGSAFHSVVMISPEMKLPEELRVHAARVELSLPDEAALNRMVREEAFAWSRNHAGRRVKVNNKAVELLVKNLRGLTLNDARQLAKNAIYNDGAITDSDIENVMREKFKLLNRDGVLSYEYEHVAFDDIAGLKSLKKWISDRKPVFESQENPYGLDPPKGVLLLGVQGCGKSLASKAVAAGFGVPLLRLDMGSIYNKYHGETEKNLRQSLNSAEVMAPCVMWIDEIEKGLSVSGSDSGTSKRVLGTLLTWMAEKDSAVFLVATANDIESLPPELVRKGRFDEIFFVDLPKPEVRQRIFEIHLSKRRQDASSFDLESLGDATDGFSGAEIEQVVVSGLYKAMAAEQSMTTEMLVQAAQATRPLSVTMAERIDYLRNWASERTVSAD